MYYGVFDAATCYKLQNLTWIRPLFAPICSGRLQLFFLALWPSARALISQRRGQHFRMKCAPLLREMRLQCDALQRLTSKTQFGKLAA